MEIKSEKNVQNNNIIDTDTGHRQNKVLVDRNKFTEYMMTNNQR